MIDKIKLLAKNPVVFEKALNIFKSGNVYISSAEPTYPNQLTLHARSSSNQITLKLDSITNKIISSCCTCGVAGQNSQLCEHELATLCYYYENDYLSTVYSSKAGENLINSYQHTDIHKAMIQRVDNQDPVRICCVVYLGKSPDMRIKIGRKHLYSVKSLIAFANNINNNDTVEYGKYFEWNHLPESVVSHQQPLLETILSLIQISVEHHDNYAACHNAHMLLTPNAIDALLPHWIEHPETLLLVHNNETEHSVKIIEENPYIPFSLQPLSRNRLLIQMPIQHTFIGAKHVAIYDGIDTLRILDPDCALSLKPLLLSMGKTGFFSILHKTDIPNFFTLVFPTISSYVAVEGDLTPYLHYQIQTFDVELRFDMPADNSISCHVNCNYPDGTINPCEYRPQLQSSYYHGRVKKQTTEIARNPKKELQFLLQLDTYFSSSDSTAYYYSGDDEHIYNFLKNTLQEFTSIGQVYISDRLQSKSITKPPKMQAQVSIEGALLSLDIQLKDFPVNELASLLTAYQQRRKYYRLKNGAFLALSDNSLSALAELSEALSLSSAQLKSGHISLPRYRAMELNTLLHKRNDITFERGTAFKTLIRSMRNSTDTDYHLPTQFHGELRDYQKDGYAWLRTISNAQLNGILADDMGLGKTIQVLALLLAHKEEEGSVRALIVCPASLVLNWQAEATRFTPTLTTQTLSGTPAERTLTINRALHSTDILISSYDQLKRDVENYQDFKFDYHIIDEAQLIKNANTKAAQSNKLINATHRFALTGTPIENRLSELWSIFDFLMPGYLYSYSKFKKTYEVPIVIQHDEVVAKRMQRIASPFILRRLKADVLSELPPKQEIVRYCNLVDEQQQLYLAHAMQVKAEFKQLIDSGTIETSKLKVLELLLRLRQLCCEPSLYVDGYNGGSAKLESCMTLVNEAVAGGHKVLIFSQFTSMLDIIEKRLRKEGIQSYMLRGSTPKPERQRIVQQFQKDDTPIFLISLKAGGLGLNLTAADTVILYDPWWNTAAETQAADRAYRMGQTRSVQVYRLIAKDTIEERILSLQKLKADLANSIVTEGNALETFSTTDMMNLL